MTNRRSIAGFYRIFMLVVFVAVAALSWLAFSFALNRPACADEAEQSGVTTYAEGSTHDDVFGATHAKSKAFSLSDEDIVYTERSKYTDSVSYYLRSGTYHLTEDLVLASSFDLVPSVLQYEGFAAAGDSLVVNICLHGHSITAPKDHVFAAYGSESVLNIYDCGGTGTVSSGRREGVYLYNHATLNLYGGNIKNCPDSGVSVSGGSVFNMYGGVITENVSSGNAGGVAVWSSGTFNMYGGTISNNTTTKYYGGAGVDITSADSVFRMYGGSIINNLLDCSNETSEDSLRLFYKGAGVDFGTGVFSIEGNVNISGNIRKYATSQEINNVEIDEADRKIEITGPLGAGAQIGITAAAGVFTSGYRTKGNTVDPSTYFTSDTGMDIGFDDLNKEGEIKTGSVVGGYNMTNATVTGVSGTATVGDTQVTFLINVTLKNNVNSSTKTVSDVVTVNLDSPLVGGKNTVPFTYSYNGADGVQTKQLTGEVTPAKLPVNVTWSCSDASATTDRFSATRNYDGNDILGDIKANYVGYDGQTYSYNGHSDKMIVKDESGNTVTSAADVGVYSIYLAPSDDYTFSNSIYTLTVVATSIEDGYERMENATAIGVFGTPTVGDTEVTIIVEVTLKHTKTEAVRTRTLNSRVTLTTALHVGDNNISFEYKYTAAANDVQTKQLSLTVTAAKKQVTVKWYFNDVQASNNSAKHVYDGADATDKVVAEYDGYDGNKKRVDGASALMLKKDANGTTVGSASNVGVYTLSLADSADYVFNNNSFTYTVVQDLSDISDLVYEENSQIILGVSSDDGFENGTELAVEMMTDFATDAVAGKVSTALNFKLVNDTVEVAPTGVITVRVLIPDELKGDANYKIYSLNNGVATEMRYTVDGDYATFELFELGTILFVTEESAPIIGGNTGVSNVVVKLDDGGLLWLWVFLAFLGVGMIILAVVLIVLTKSNKKSGANKENKDKS